MGRQRDLGRGLGVELLATFYRTDHRRRELVRRKGSVLRGSVLPAPVTDPINYLEQASVREFDLRGNDHPLPGTGRFIVRLEFVRLATDLQVRVLQATVPQAIGPLTPGTCRIMAAAIGGIIIRTRTGAGTITPTTGGPGPPLAP